LIINHQYRYLPFALKIKEAVDRGDLGQVLHLSTSCTNKLHGQGTHMIDLANFLHGDVKLQWVMGHVSGTETYDSKLPGPDRDAAVFAYEDGVRLFVECGPQVPKTDPDTKLHLYIEVVGTEGRAWGGIDSGYRIHKRGGEIVSERLRWKEGSHLAQVALVRDILAGLEANDAKMHRSRAELGRRTQDALIGVIQSSVEHKLVEFPVSAPPRYLEYARRVLDGA